MEADEEEKVITIKIDHKHSAKLMAGEPVAIKVPAGAKAIKLQLMTPRESLTDMAKILDVFFNGRKV